jgi:hypothetical protein
MRSSLLAAGITAAALFGGAAAGIALTTPSLASAQTEVTTPAADDTSSTSDTATDDNDGLPGPMAEAIQGLVDSGTLNQAQADAVTAALEAAKPEGRGGRGHGRGGPGLDAAATALGVTEDELHTALHDGQTVAEIATAKGVAVQTVIDAMVADAKEHLAEAVTDGRLTQAEADEKAADLTERITTFVNEGRPERGDSTSATDSSSTTQG